MHERLFIDTSDIEVAEAQVGDRLRALDLDDVQAGRDVEDALEVWIAALLAVHPRWTHRGRWYDGLLLESCVPTDGGLAMRGFIYTIEAQRKIWFSAVVSTPATGLAFTLEVGSPGFPPMVWIRTTPPDARVPLHRWGVVAGGAISAIRVDVVGGGFLIITIEPRGTFDVWVEREDDVVEALTGLAVSWDPAGLELR